MNPKAPNPEGDRAEIPKLAEQQPAGESLRQIVILLEAAQAQARIGSWQLQPQMETGWWSKQMFRLFDLEPSPTPPALTEFLEMLHPEDRERVKRLHWNILESSALSDLEYRTNPARGPVRYFRATVKVEKDGEGQLPQIVGTVQDITDRKQKEEALRSSERKLAEIFRSSPQFIVVSRSADGLLIEVNDAFTRLLDYPREEILNHTSLDIGLWPTREERERVVRQVSEQGEARNLECRLRKKSGEIVEVLLSVAPIVLEGENCLIWLATDISQQKQTEQERVRLQDQLQQAMKMEAVGRLAGGVAHDFNNLLTVIKGNIDLARSDLSPADPLMQNLLEVSKAADSAASLTRQLLAFSRRQIIEPKVVNLNDLLVNLRQMLVRLIGEDISLQTFLAEDLSAVKIDPGQFEQVVVNLAVNARDAMPDGGKLTLETANRNFDEDDCPLHPDIHPGRYVMLTVSDTGHGMDAEVKHHLFEPFFTTKPKGKGTGLGLPMIYGAVKQSGGTIEVDSEVGRGTLFKIYLPRVEQQAEKLTKPAAPSELPEGNETVLLVEDEPSVRNLATNVLKRLGYHLLPASNGGEAFMLAEKYRQRIDLLMTDVVMPGMTGRELSGRLQQFHPEMRVLFTSGYTEEVMVQHGVLDGRLNFLGKPYSMQVLASKVREVLDAESARE